MLSLRPHILKYQEIVSEGYDDLEGNHIPGILEFKGSIPCRAELNHKAAKVAFDDGSTFVYSWTVYLDKVNFKTSANTLFYDPVTNMLLGDENYNVLATLATMREIKEGDVIQVFNGEELLFEKPIHGKPYKKCLHTKIFV